ncbi:glycosyltransferase family 2 protein [Rossellomorea aquimaris]|uniref:Glycosyltransferase family 2 protein n=1 Tax=Rossellomorea aquimaris TaxID=189382 RepID=A0A5D4TWE6_9BACI|nr:glycosyltransferase family 2 protein [Rossellomorea aquimaris]TYS78556.1 glycosyltransferase family 2 protein [Rossellomorea aquimaris]
MTNLSIIIPHFNSVQALNKLLKTIPDIKDIQIIVIDDNSDMNHKKKLLELIKGCNRQNIEFYNNYSPNKGAGACRNIGLNRSKGKWLLFADSDDYFIDGYLDVIQRYLDSNNDVIFFKPTSIEVDTGNQAERHLAYSKLIDSYLGNHLNSEIYLRYCFSVPWSKLIKTSFVKKNNISFDEVIAANDLMFSTKVGYLMGNFEVSEEIIYCVTRNKGSLTTTVSHKVFDTRLNVFINYNKFLKEHLIKEEFNTLGLSSVGFLISAFKKFGVKKVCLVYFKLRKNKVRLFNPKMCNPIWFMNKTLYVIRKNKSMKRYYNKIE